MAEQTFYITTLLSKTELAPEMFELRFAKPDGFTFLPGQFVQFRIPEEEKHVLRSYSISSVPSDPFVEFCVKLLPGGKASGLFSGLSVGESVQFGQARGMFIAKPEHSPRKIFVATGAGLAPIMSLLRSLTPNTAGDLQLLFGVRSERDIFWQDRITDLQRLSPSFRSNITVSQPSDLWQGVRGRVTSHVQPIDLTAEYYLCGSLEMVKEVRSMLSEAGISPKQVHLEIF